MPQHFKREAILHDEQRRRFRWALFGLLSLYSLIFLVSCGDGPEGNPVSPTRAQPAQRVLQQGSFTLRAPVDDAVYFGVVPVTDSASDSWEANVDWRSEANTMWMWVADGACSVEQFETGGCPFDSSCPCRITIRSETGTPKPRVLTIAGASGGTRTLIVANLGPGEETVQYRVMLTSSAGTAGASVQTTSVTDSRRVSTARKTGLTQR